MDLLPSSPVQNIYPIILATHHLYQYSFLQIPNIQFRLYAYF